MANLPADLRKLLEWLDRVSPLLEAQIVAAGFNQTLDKALMRNFAEMNLREATVSITARGRDASSKFPVMRVSRARPRNFNDRATSFRRALESHRHFLRLCEVDHTREATSPVTDKKQDCSIMNRREGHRASYAALRL
jgi:hypothetical protein